MIYNLKIVRLSSSTAYYLLILLLTKYSNFLTILKILHPPTVFILELLGVKFFPKFSDPPKNAETCNTNTKIFYPPNLLVRSQYFFLELTLSSKEVTPQYIRILFFISIFWIFESICKLECLIFTLALTQHKNIFGNILSFLSFDLHTQILVTLETMVAF